MQSLDATEDFAIRLVRRFLQLCENPRTRAVMLRMVRQSTKGGAEAPQLYRWINRTVLRPTLVRAGLPASALKAELVASQLIGLAMLRYVLRVEPMASASIDEVVALSAPAVRAAMAGSEALSPYAVPVERPLTTRRAHAARAVRRRVARVRARA